jgi:DNA-directed RNA polymerase subunit M/transcription elongation factor TFIIS
MDLKNPRDWLPIIMVAILVGGFFVLIVGNTPGIGLSLSSINLGESKNGDNISNQSVANKTETNENSKNKESTDSEKTNDPAYHIGQVGVPSCPSCGSDNVGVLSQERIDGVTYGYFGCNYCGYTFEISM